MTSLITLDHGKGEIVIMKKKKKKMPEDIITQLWKKENISKHKKNEKKIKKIFSVRIHW